MKIILTTVSPNLDSEIDPRFGRGAYFLIVDCDSLAWEAHPNPGIDAAGGAGSLAAQFVANQKPVAAISGDFGPNAYNALRSADVEMYLFGPSRTAHETVERFKAGLLERVGAPTGAGRHSRA